MNWKDIKIGNKLIIVRTVRGMKPLENFRLFQVINRLQGANPGTIPVEGETEKVMRPTRDTI